MDSPLPFQVSRASAFRGSGPWPWHLRVLRSRGPEKMIAGPFLFWIASVIPIIAAGLAALTFAAFPSWVFDSWGVGDSQVMRILLYAFRVGAGVFGAIFVIAGVALLVVTFRRRIVFDRRAGVLRAGGRGPDIPLADVAAVQLLSCSGSGGIELNLVLRKPAGDRIMVTYGSDEGRLRPHAERLAAFLQVPLLDHIRQPIAVGHEVLQVDRGLIPGWTTGYRTMALRPGRSGQMILRATRRQHFLQWVLLGAGLLAIYLGIMTGVGFIPSDPDTSVPEKVVGTAFSCLVGLVLVLVALTAFSERRVVFDRAAGTIRGKRLKIGRARVREIPLGNVSAIQLCGQGAKTVLEQEGGVLQINLVLREPPGARVRLVTHGKESAIREDARQLSEFLKVPLLDHTL